MSRRIRFGLIFVGPSPATDGGFLRDLGIRQIEGCSLRNKHYVLFTVERPKRSSDILEAVGAQNRVSSRGESTELEEELMMASDGVLMDGASTIVLMPVDSGDSSGGVSVAKSSSSAPGGSRHSLVAVFDKGHAFQSHEIFRMICAAKLSHMQVSAPPALGDRETIQPSSYWSWSAPGVLDPSSGKKRVVSELSSDLVETSIKPSSSKRVSLSSSPVPPPPPPPPKEVASDIEGEVFGVSGGSSGIDIVAEAAGGDDTAGLPSAPPPVDVMGDDAFEAQVGNTSILVDPPPTTDVAPETKSRSSSSRRRTAPSTGGGGSRRRGAGDGSLSKANGGSVPSTGASVEAMSLVRELAKARQETIRAKDQLIQVLLARQSSAGAV